MKVSESQKDPGTFKNKTKIPIWLTSTAVILLILLLALTVNHAREREIVNQFSRQQTAIARGTATGIGDFISGIEKSMLLISRLPYVRGIASEPTGQSFHDPGKKEYTGIPSVRETREEVITESIKVIYEDLGGKVDFIALENTNGVLTIGYPPSALKEILGQRIEPRPYFQEIRKTGKPYIGTMVLSSLSEENSGTSNTSHAVIIAVPTYNASNRFSGAVVASLSLSTIVERYIAPRRELSCCAWIMDRQGMIIAHPDPASVGTNVGSLKRSASGEEGSLAEALDKEREGYGEYNTPGAEGRQRKTIIAYAPVDLSTEHLFVAIATPYNEIALLARKGFINVMLGAMGLILVFIVAGIAIATARAGQLRIREELKRLTEREEWQEKLLHEHRKTEGIIEGSPIPTFVLDKEHHVTHWNRACAELTGVTASAVIGSDQHSVALYNGMRPTIADTIIDADTETLEKYYGKKEVRKSTTVKGAYEATDFFPDLGGESRYLYFLAAPIYDEQGKIIAAIETMQDVTRQKEMDIRLQEYAETLQSELDENVKLREKVEGLYNYLQSIIDSLPDRILDIDQDGIISYVSRDLKNGEGIISSTFGGKHFTDFVEEKNQALVLDRWMAAQEGHLTPYEITATAKDGSERNLLVTLRPVKGTDHFLLVQRDITEFKALEKKFYESQKLAAIGQLSAGIAHEVRNPLSSIKMSLQVLEKRMQPEGNDLKRFKIAQREVEHLETLVNDILMYSKPSDPVKKPSNIEQIVDHALAMTENNIVEKHIRVKKAFPDGLPSLAVDPAMLEQMFLNIYRNAIDAMEDGGTLSISARQENNRIRVAISDDGCGISRDDMPHIFNPFFTRKSTGTGLGLTQIKKIVDMHQGSIEMSSEEGKGTRVDIGFPLETGEGTSPPAP